MSGARTLRTFVALPLSEEIHEQLAGVQRRLKRTDPGGSVRWVDPSSIHLTLHFLGDILPERVEPVRAALSVVARNVTPFEFQVGNLGAFPNTGRPRVVWVGVQDTSSWLRLLHDAVNEALANLGFTPDKRGFSPHLTLGRVRRNAERGDVRALGQTIAETEIGMLGTVQAREMVFFRSVLKPTGAEYTPLHTFRL
jgi:RNA 2',3'-cyclic 3'-phosphodiesterase